MKVVDKSSHEYGFVIILTWNILKMNEENSVIEDDEENTLEFSYTDNIIYD